MPICQIKTNFHMDEKTKKDFSDRLATSLSSILNKPLPAVMISISEEFMYMNCSEDTVLFAEFKYCKEYIDANEKKEFLKSFSEHMLEIIHELTNVDPHRVYMQFTHMQRDEAWRYIEKNNERTL